MPVRTAFSRLIFRHSWSAITDCQRYLSCPCRSDVQSSNNHHCRRRPLGAVCTISAGHGRSMGIDRFRRRSLLFRMRMALQPLQNRTAPLYQDDFRQSGISRSQNALRRAIISHNSRRIPQLKTDWFFIPMLSRAKSAQYSIDNIRFYIKCEKYVLTSPQPRAII